MPAELVDVNVHPTKQEVRFQDSGRLYSQLLGTLRMKFLTTDLRARGASPETIGHAAVEDFGNATSGASQLVEWAKQELGKQQPREVEAPTSFGAEGGPARAYENPEPLRLHRLDMPPFRPFERGSSGASTSRGGESFEQDHERANYTKRGDVSRPEGTATRGAAVAARGALQVHNRYLVVENEAGIEVIDQHALHERILYEQIREKVLAGALESQKLLVPEPVDLAATEAAAVLEHADLLAQLGVQVQPFGGETVLVSSYPAMLANLSPADVLHDLVEKLLPGGRRPEARDLLDEMLHMIACKAAVKFGDRLTAEEIDALLAQRELVQDQHHCPHGRPTALVFTREDLDRQFKRI
jgi:DNA mismatch repair protein MutL